MTTSTDSSKTGIFNPASPGAIGGTTPAAGTFTKVTVTGGTTTTDNPLITGTQTWNDAGVTFTGYKLNITNTASAAGSSLLDLQIGGSSRFRVTKGDSNGAYVRLSNDAGNPQWTQDGSGRFAITRNDSTGDRLDWVIRNLILASGVGTNSGPGTILTENAARTIASAATIAPVGLINFISGTTTISTITPPSLGNGGAVVTLIPTGLWSTDTSGNIALATTAVVNKALTLYYDTATTKWYPSYS
jgi:hypothetical protein